MLDIYRFKTFQKYPKLLHLVTQKSSSMPYSFSLALHTGEDEKAILENRQSMAKQLQATKNLYFVVAKQTHSDNIHIVTQEETKGWESQNDAIENCDALITKLPNVMLSVLTADCVPILLYDEKKGVIAAVHAGWKGTKAKIVYKTVTKMVQVFGSNPQDIVAGIAPSIGACCYEVGEDVARHFAHTPKCMTTKEDKSMLDLPYLNKMQLLKAGLTDANITLSNICTSCEVEHYFSYRKEQGCTGRFMSMIGLKDAYAS